MTQAMMSITRMTLVAVAALAVVFTGCRTVGATDEDESAAETSDGKDAPAAVSMAEYLAAQETIALVERSDWTNVKTDVEPAAVGDGVADDTEALQTALSMLEGKNPETAVVYLPPGTYRITDTLTVRKVQGGAIYGHGRATRIVWDGPEGTVTKSRYGAEIVEGARMFHSDGFGRNLFYGLTFDGQNRAGVGIDHDSTTYYETRTRHQYCAFYNFTDSGIRIGRDQVLASAEQMFYDNLFVNCRRGISTLEFNDYNNHIVRNIFRDCGTAVYCYRGNVTIRDSHFEGSTERDVLLPPHSHSIRRCTSTGSRAFVQSSQPGHYSLKLALQDCVVEGWTSPRGAMQLGNSGPYLFFDSDFRNPADGAGPAMAVNAKEAIAFKSVTLIQANLRSDGKPAQLPKSPVRHRVTVVPRSARENLMDVAGHQRWAHRPVLPGKIFDAVEDFGADPTGRKNASSAIQAAINAAAEAGDGAEAYLPAGRYAIKTPLKLGPGNYRLAGSIFNSTKLSYGGPSGGAILRVHNANGATLSQLVLLAPKDRDTTGLHVTADRPGELTLDGIYAAIQYNLRFQGTHLDHLPKGYKVRSPHLNGSTLIDHCGDAQILLDSWYAGYGAGLTVSGPTGNGFIGIHAAVASKSDPDLKVLDSASIVVGDFYTEQTEAHLMAEGAPDDPPGRVTISNAKLATRRPEAVRVDGYQGLVSVSGAGMRYEPAGRENPTERKPHQSIFPATGGPNTRLLLMGNTHRISEPFFDPKPETTLRGLGNFVVSAGGKSGNALMPDQTGGPGWEDDVNAALDHFRELSKVELTGGR